MAQQYGNSAASAQDPQLGEAGIDDGYVEPSSIFISDDWDVIGEDYLDDYDDLGDVDLPTLDDDY